MLYKYVPLPPAADNSTEPSDPSQPATFAVKLSVKSFFTANPTEVVAVHSLASITVKVYVPGARPLNSLLDWKSSPLMLKVRGSVPPEAAIVTVPGVLQVGAVVDATLTVGPDTEQLTGISSLPLQPAIIRNTNMCKIEQEGRNAVVIVHWLLPPWLYKRQANTLTLRLKQTIFNRWRSIQQQT
ncbi:hypothetical protein IMPERIA89_240018 [Imperialibacter sp. 89]|nr:hypothetical protein IMPERIA89_240018 [Imperialibacter sp. 89]CAD5271758.1 hypothetical protein IMPERIA75_390018 [Imperialibacter sp. 75]